ncbi:type II toxin-antitoxin system HicB family antitoxin [Campylobacter lari]|nr:type II toxin-antitoxin system HicB family antitoxin [Campylobacter lari]MCR6528517.1 type II toxin-antitoxin system HicB family antitoxin [Campylobacter lari]MCR6557932.1 type II toxin-antitoxin system HicB family antitoxin [Campylobacter lari]
MDILYVFENCISQGNTYKKTLTNIKEARRLYLENINLKKNY